MNFVAALDLATKLSHFYGMKVPTFGQNSPIAQCWVDRVASVERARDIINEQVAQTAPEAGKRLFDAIAEANRYSGR
jgi:hypothetical protein